MKRCGRCGEMKPLDQFPPVRRDAEKRQSWCRACFAAANAANYAANREREKARLLRNLLTRRVEIRALLVAYLLAHPCVDCGETDIVVLEFDHVGGRKRGDVSAYANGTRAWTTISEEIARCEVRCANCHRRKTAARRGGSLAIAVPYSQPRRRTDVMQLALDSVFGLRRCRVCGETKPLTHYPFRSRAAQTRKHICLECQRAYAAAWYAKNRQRQLASVKRGKRVRRQAAREFVRSYLLAHACVDCGEADTVVLEFDHRGNKLADVSSLVRSGASHERLRAEIEKCDVRCANCHRRRTCREIESYRVVASR